MGILLALLAALLVCAAVCLVIWGIAAVLSMFVPSPPMNVIRIVLWVVGGIVCIVVLLEALQGQPVLPLLLSP